MNWQSIVESDTTSTLSGYPVLVAALSRDLSSMKAGREDEMFKEDLKKIVNPADELQLKSLLEMFPNMAPKAVCSAFIAANFVTESAISVLLSSNASSSIIDDAPLLLAASTVLESRFEFIKRLNEDFGLCTDVINFNQSGLFYSIAYMLSVHRGYLLHVTKVS
jgi:hypothetical protein